MLHFPQLGELAENPPPHINPQKPATWSGAIFKGYCLMVIVGHAEEAVSSWLVQETIDKHENCMLKSALGNFFHSFVIAETVRHLKTSQACMELFKGSNSSP